MNANAFDGKACKMIEAIRALGWRSVPTGLLFAFGAWQIFLSLLFGAIVSHRGELPFQLSIASALFFFCGGLLCGALLIVAGITIWQERYRIAAITCCLGLAMATLLIPLW